MLRLDGKSLAESIKRQLRESIAEAKVHPILAVILVGDDPASQVYVGNKQRACEAIGMGSEVHKLPASCDEKELLARIESLNQRPEISGILLQLPLPKSLDPLTAMAAIDPHKDADALTPYQQGMLALGRDSVRPCTPSGIMQLLDAAGISVAGKHAVVIGRSNIVGKPMAQMLLSAGATVTQCHRQTPDFSVYTKQADIVIAAAGVAKILKASMLARGAVVIDVGIHRSASGLCGDLDVEGLADDQLYAHSPVPGGVGPMTIAALLQNCWRLHCQRHGIEAKI